MAKAPPRTPPWMPDASPPERSPGQAIRRGTMRPCPRRYTSPGARPGYRTKRRSFVDHPVPVQPFRWQLDRNVEVRRVHRLLAENSRIPGCLLVGIGANSRSGGAEANALSWRSSWCYQRAGGSWWSSMLSGCKNIKLTLPAVQVLHVHLTSPHTHYRRYLKSVILSTGRFEDRQPRDFRRNSRTVFPPVGGKWAWPARPVRVRAVLGYRQTYCVEGFQRLMT